MYTTFVEVVACRSPPPKKKKEMWTDLQCNQGFREETQVSENPDFQDSSIHRSLEVTAHKGCEVLE